MLSTLLQMTSAFGFTTYERTEEKAAQLRRKSNIRTNQKKRTLLAT